MTEWRGIVCALLLAGLPVGAAARQVRDPEPLDVARIFAARYPETPSMSYIPGLAWDATWQRFDVFCGPPEITAPDGSTHVEPASRVLEVSNVKISDLRQPISCDGRAVESIVPAAGRVQVEVSESGRVATARITRSTGDVCRDEVLTNIASALWYQWIPNDRFPAPLDLVQPLRVAESSM